MKKLTCFCLSFGAAFSGVGQISPPNLYSHDPGGILRFSGPSTTLPPSYDNTNSGQIALSSTYLTNGVQIGISPIMFCGKPYSNLWVNEDGNVALDGPFSGHWPPAYVPALALSNLNRVVFAPFWADCDTSSNGSGTVSWGTQGAVFVGPSNTYCPVFYATWSDVGYYKGHTDKTNSFQMLLIYRTNRPFGSFDLQYRYAGIQWDTADSGSGIGGTCDFGAGYPARVGYACGAGAVEWTNSGICGALLDGVASALVSNHLSAPDYQPAVNGVYTWEFSCPVIVNQNSAFTIGNTNLSAISNAIPSTGTNFNGTPAPPP